MFSVISALVYKRSERAGRSFQKPNDLAREAVSCNAGLGGRLVESHALVDTDTSYALAIVPYSLW